MDLEDQFAFTRRKLEFEFDDGQEIWREEVKVRNKCTLKKCQYKPDDTVQQQNQQPTAGFSGGTTNAGEGFYHKGPRKFWARKYAGQAHPAQATEYYVDVIRFKVNRQD